MKFVIWIPGWGNANPISVSQLNDEDLPIRKCIYCDNDGTVKFACSGMRWNGYLYMCDKCRKEQLISRPSADFMSKAVINFTNICNARIDRRCAQIMFESTINEATATSLVCIIRGFLKSQDIE
jgi:hypothetical protein